MTDDWRDDTPQRRLGERDHKEEGSDDGGFNYSHPWLGSFSATGQYVIAMIAIVAITVGGGIAIYYEYQASINLTKVITAHTTAIDELHNTIREIKKDVRKDHRVIMEYLDYGNSVDQEMFCMSLLDQASRRTAVRTGSGSVCAYLGIRSRPPMEQKRNNIDRDDDERR